MRTPIIIAITAIVSIGLAESRHLIGAHSADGEHTGHDHHSAIHSPYAGEQNNIKALSNADVNALLQGAGTPFGGMAKPGELNGYPGPLHVLQAIEAGEFEVTAAQQTEIARLYENMKSQAVPLGEQIVAAEKKIDASFVNKTVTAAELQTDIKASATLYAELRLTHLLHHLHMIETLTPAQVERYNTLRGYQ